MNHLSKVKGVMNWILMGSIIGLSIGLLRILFNWDRTFANYVLFGTAGVIFLAFFLRMLWDYFKVKKFLNQYMGYLELKQMDKYILSVNEAIEKTKTKSLKDIHRMNLAIGYSYMGDYDEAINQLRTVYDTTKRNSKTSVFCLINIIYLAILKKDYVVANRLVTSTRDVLDMYEKDAQFGLLININHAYLALERDSISDAKQYLVKADAISKALSSGVLELTKLKIEFALANHDLDDAKENIELFKTLDLPPIEQSWLDSLMVKHNIGETERTDEYESV